MTVILNKGVQADVRNALRYYEKVSGESLAGDFYMVLMKFILAAAENPRKSHLYAKGLSRANLERFPYYLLYRERKDAI